MICKYRSFTFSVYPGIDCAVVINALNHLYSCLAIRVAMVYEKDTLRVTRNSF